MMNAQDWSTLSEAYAFIGNSLLAPMTQTDVVGLDPAFWAAFPDFGDGAVRAAADTCAEYACTLRDEAAGAVADGDGSGADGDEADVWPTHGAVQHVAVEYTHLFVGPPRPAAAPWETFYLQEEVTAGFGEATFQMRALLREAGLELAGASNQYEDHMGIELLLLSELCRRAAAGELPAGETAATGLLAENAAESFSGVAAAESSALDATSVAAFIVEHPLSWVGKFAAAVDVAAPGGYFAHLLDVERALLQWQVSQLA